MKPKSKQPRKQRKRRFNLKPHQKRKLLRVTLSKELREKFKRRNMAVRRGDKVKVITGISKGTEGEVMNVNYKSCKVYVDKLVVKKRDGTEVLRAMEPSNLMITDLDIRDKMRQAVLQRKVSKDVVDAEVKKEEARLKKEEAELKRKEAEMKAKEAEKKAEKEEKEEAKAEKKAAKTGKQVKKKKVSEKGIDDKTKKDWIAGK